MSATDNAVLMFMTLFGLYSPLAALPSYMPIIGRYEPEQQRRLALGLFLYVVTFVLAAIWVGEVLLEVLGISTAALTATGGIALMLEAVPLMLNLHPAGAPSGADTLPEAEAQWRSVLLLPLTFPLTVGGATFAVLVGFAATTHGAGDRALLTVAGLAYAAVTGITLYASAHAHRRASPRAREMLDRIAGILLTAIASMLLASGATRLVIRRARQHQEVAASLRIVNSVAGSVNREAQVRKPVFIAIFVVALVTVECSGPVADGA